MSIDPVLLAIAIVGVVAIGGLIAEDRRYRARRAVEPLAPGYARCGACLQGYPATHYCPCEERRA